MAYANYSQVLTTKQPRQHAHLPSLLAQDLSRSLSRDARKARSLIKGEKVGLICFLIDYCMFLERQA